VTGTGVEAADATDDVGEADGAKDVFGVTPALCFTTAVGTTNCGAGRVEPKGRGGGGGTGSADVTGLGTAVARLGVSPYVAIFCSNCRRTVTSPPPLV
jgi:hypothetical protein